MIYVEGRNDNKLLAHTPGCLTGRVDAALGPRARWPAMRGEHYPITEIGIANLCRQLIKRGESAGDPSQVRVKRDPARAVQTGLARCWK